MELSSPKPEKLVFKEELPKPQKPFQKSYEQFFPKTLLDGSFHLLSKLNQTTITVYKNIESFLLC